MTKTVAICTLGCKVNTYESEAAKEQFVKNGYSVVDFSSAADVYIVNTCTVTHLSDRKSRQMIRRAKHKNPDAVLVVMGCFAQTAPEKVREIDGVDIIIGNEGKGAVYDKVEAFLSEKTRIEAVTDIGALRTFEPLFVKGSERTRAVLKVQDGCNNFCSYCIIPYARGRNRSNPMEVCLKDANELVRAGFTEIVLTGIHLASYGKDLDDCRLIDLLEELEKIDGLERIRLGSLEPTLFDAEFCARMARFTKLCRHFHLSLQSGCDETLARMNRKYTTAEYLEAVKRIREVFPDAAITTDIMTGFPGETDEEFEKTLSFVEAVSFSDTHIFQYSVRAGTRAEKMSEQIAPDVKEARSQRLISLTSKTRDAFLKGFVGREMNVLFEQKHKGDKKTSYEGKTDNYITVVAKSCDDISGQMLCVKITDVKNGLAYGTIIETE